MNCRRVRELFPDLLAASASATVQQEAHAHLASCPECQREFSSLAQMARALDQLPAPQPSPRLRQNFHAMLDEERRRASTARPAASAARRAMPEPPPLRWRWALSSLAGCALLALGFFAGQRSSPVSSTPAPAPAADVVSTAGDSTRRELAALREQIDQQRQQLEKMTTLVGYSILQQQRNPANERLQDVLTAARSDNVNDRTLDDLIQAVTLDPSANVRLRAIEALYAHAERETVRAGVLAALPREQNPLVQLELIDFVATAQVRSATPVLEQISVDESTHRTVRDAARLALAQL